MCGDNTILTSCSVIVILCQIPCKWTIQKTQQLFKSLCSLLKIHNTWIWIPTNISLGFTLTINYFHTKFVFLNYCTILLKTVYHSDTIVNYSLRYFIHLQKLQFSSHSAPSRILFKEKSYNSQFKSKCK